jgi:hypothetical protein
MRDAALQPGDMAMKTNSFDLNSPSDEELLAGVRRHMTGVESLVPLPRAWDGAGARVGSSVRVGVRPRVGFAGLVPLVLVAVLVVVAVGFGMGSKTWGGAGGAATYTTLTYRLVPVSGQPPASSGLDVTVSIVKERLELAGMAGILVAAGALDTVVVKVPAGGDVVGVQKVVGAIGHIEFVLLPPAEYGTADAAGAKAVPAKGDAIDPTLPARFTGADLDPAKIQAVVDPNASPGSWKILFGFTTAGGSQFETWTGAHVAEYLAIVVDGVIQTVPSIQSAITGGSGEITGDYTQSEASQLAAVLKSGQLPYPLELVQATSPAGSSGA